MGIAAIDLLSGAARLALPFVSQGVAAGLKSADIISALSSAGLTFRRTDMLSLIRTVAGTPAQRSYTSSLRGGFLPNPARFQEAATFTQGRYSYLVRLTGTHPLTGETTSRYISITSNSVITKNDAVQSAMEATMESPTLYSIYPEQGAVETIVRSPLFPD